MSLYSSLTQVLAPYAAKLNGLLTGYDGTTYATPGEAVRTQINDLHVLIGDEEGTAIQASAVAYEDTTVEAELESINAQISDLGSGVSTEVRQALYTLLSNVAFDDNATYTDELAVIESWATECTAVTLSASTASISGTDTVTLTATTTPTGGTVTWTSSNDAVATVSAGVVTGVNNGSATITATCGDCSATCTVTVTGFAELTGITATYSGGSVYDTASLSSLTSDLVVTAEYDDSTSVTLTSDDYTLSGTLTEGTSTITVTYGSYTDTFDVTVISSTISISWTGSGTDSYSPVIDATEHAVYLTIPYVEGDSHLIDGVTSDSTPFKQRTNLYSDAECTALVGYYYTDTAEVESTNRTTANSPWMHFDTSTCVVPAGYYAKILMMKSGSAVFSSNANSRAYLNAYVTTASYG